LGGSKKRTKNRDKAKLIIPQHPWVGLAVEKRAGCFDIVRSQGRVRVKGDLEKWDADDLRSPSVRGGAQFVLSAGKGTERGESSLLAGSGTPGRKALDP